MENTQNDPMGNVVDMSRWNITDNKYEMISRSVYSYNRKGKILETSAYDGNGTLEYRQVYKYDKNGKNIHTWTEDADYLEIETITKYNSAGKMIESEKRNPKGRLKEQTNIKYNSKGEMVEEGYKIFGYEEKLKYRGYVDIFNYDPNGNLIEKKEYIIEKDSAKKLEISEDTLDTKTIYKYDSNDKLIEENKFGAWGTEQSVEKIKYEDGNKVEKIIYSGGSINQITYYKIEDDRVVERTEFDIDDIDIHFAKYNVVPDPDRKYSYLYEEYK
jgi:hypothetical protein